MNIANQRILIFGDSLSHHGGDYDVEIYDVDPNENPSQSTPGDLLASELLNQGAAAVRIDANVGRSAINFWGPNHARWQMNTPDDLIANDQAWNPDKVIVFLGTNDLGSDPNTDQVGFQQIKDAFPSAQFVAIGPPIFADTNRNAQADIVYQTLNSVFGAANVIDSRPISSTDGRARDGVHFGPSAAVPFASNLLDALNKTGNFSLGKAVLYGILGVGALVVGGAIYGRYEHKRSQLQGEVAQTLGYEPEPPDEETAAWFTRTGGKPLMLAGSKAREEWDGLSRDEVREKLSKLGDELRELRASKPRPLLKLYKHPTPEQEAEWRARMAAWNSAYRKASRAHKIGVEVSNELYYAQSGVKVEDLKRQREQLYRALDYAGNTDEQVKRYHEEIKDLDAKIAQA